MNLCWQRLDVIRFDSISTLEKSGISSEKERGKGNGNGGGGGEVRERLIRTMV